MFLVSTRYAHHPISSYKQYATYEQRDRVATKSPKSKIQL